MVPIVPKPQVVRPPEPDDEDDLDFYYEGPYLVFTEAYHRRRGYCCESGCRHCPYREEREERGV